MVAPNRSQLQQAIRFIACSIPNDGHETASQKQLTDGRANQAQANYTHTTIGNRIHNTDPGNNTNKNRERRLCKINCQRDAARRKNLSVEKQLAAVSIILV